MKGEQAMNSNIHEPPASWCDSAFATGVTHFIGIGGVGMSSVAETLLKFGGDVSGSDTRTSANTDRLAGLGAKVVIGHDANNIDKCSTVVFSTAIKADNPEIVEARARQIPVMHRAEVLAELMRMRLSIAVSGTHGKTTTTSLIASLLDAGGLDPTVVNGGIMNAYCTNSKVGTGDWMVVEADESDGSFLKLRPNIAVVTNMDPEHLDHYGDFDAVRHAFREFVQNIPSHGCAVICSDHPEAEALAADIKDRRLVTYGTGPQAQVRALNIISSPESSTFDVQIARTNSDPFVFKELKTPILGRHNVLNSLAAVAVASELDVDAKAIRNGLMNFGGVKRRFTTTGIARGVRVIDDYGHHPVEISAVLQTARESHSQKPGKIVAVFQPYRFTRVRDLFDDFCRCFDNADTVIVADVYSAGEPHIDGADKEALVTGLRRAGHRNVISLSSASGLAAQVAKETTQGSLAICFGAGDITDWAYALPGQLD